LNFSIVLNLPSLKNALGSQTVGYQQRPVTSIW
jgi:hypothetical protein